MKEREVSNFCTLLLAFSMVLRTFLALGYEEKLDRQLRQRSRSQKAFTQQEEVTPAPRLWPVYISAMEPRLPAGVSREYQPLPALTVPDRAEPLRPELEFTQQEAEAISLAGGCDYPVDKWALLSRDSTMELSGQGPKVLIVHTHTSEAYTQEAGWFYTESEDYRTADADHSVVRVGQRIAELLNEQGIETLHETALNDAPNYDGAYWRMEQTIDAYLARYPSIQMVLDIHRDAAPDGEDGQAGFWTEVDGQSCAKVMLVVGTDQGGLEHPNWQENLANALKLQAVLTRKTPGLCRALDLRTERFNQHETPGSLLVEFGAAGNTLQEALRAAEVFAEGLGELLLSLG